MHPRHFLPQTGAAVVLLAALTLLPVPVQAGAEDNPVARLISLERAGMGQVAAQHVARLTRADAADARFAAPALHHNRDWVMSRPAPTLDAQGECLARALYHEARGESIEGQVAVAEVILNRVDSPAFPGTICAVINQGARGAVNGQCQFSFACDGNPVTMNEAEARALARRISDLMLAGAPRTLAQGATHFHTTQVAPPWARVYDRVAQIGAHVFYRGNNT